MKSKGRIQRHKGASILAYLGISSKNTIELDEMVSSIQKSTLNKLPDSERETCKSIFHEFVFSQKSFELPVPTFLALYSKAKNTHTHLKPSTKAKEHSRRRNSSCEDNVDHNGCSLIKKTHSRVSSLVVPPSPQGKNSHFELYSLQQAPNRARILASARCLSQERTFITYDNQFFADLKEAAEPKPLPRPPTLRPKKVLSVPPVECRDPGVGYTELLKKKQTLRNKKRSTHKRGKSGEFKGTCPDVQHLLEIRRAHLALSSLK